MMNWVRTLARVRRPMAAVAIVGTMLSTFLLAGAVPALAQGSNDWAGFLYDAGHSSYNAGATAITPATVPSLQEVWKWITPASTNTGTNELLASPTVVNGVVYIGAMDGNFYAVSEATHSVLWSDFLGLETAKNNDVCGPNGKGIISTATVTTVNGTLTAYVASPDGNFYALNASTGATIWTGHMYTPSTTVDDYYAWGSPLVAHGNVYIGLSSDCDTPLIPGGLLSFNATTGALVAQFNSTPAGANNDGGSIWSSPVLAASGDILVTTGNGYSNSGQPPYNESVIDLNPTTLVVNSFWAIPFKQQVNDADFGASPTVWTATINGVSTNMVGACNKNGLYYALNQADLAAGPVWETTITVPYNGASQECDSAAIWNGTDLIIGGGAGTTINGTSYTGSVQALDPATGVPIWQTGLDSTIVGSPTEDGGGVVAAQTYQTTNHQLGVFLLNASDGSQLSFIQTQEPMFGQAVFVGNDLLIGAGGTFGLQDFAVPSAGTPITGVSPSTIPQDANETVTLTGSGFSGNPLVQVSGNSVSVSSETVTSSTTMTVKLFAGSGATTGARNISVIEPGTGSDTWVADTCDACLTVTPTASKPTVTSINPSSFTVGSTKTAATITGTNFVSGATVTSHSGITLSVTSFVSSTQLDVTVTVSSTTAAGTYNIWLTNPSGSAAECTGCLTVTTGGPTKPTVTSINPSSLAPGSTKTAATITGTNFVAGATATSHSGIKVAVTSCRELDAARRDSDSREHGCRRHLQHIRLRLEL